VDVSAVLESDFVLALALLTGRDGKPFYLAGGSHGIYRSDADGGALRVLDTYGEGVTAMAVAPGAGDMVYAAIPGALFRSDDAGETWRAQPLPTPSPTVTSLAFSPDFTRDKTLFVGTLDDGVIRSNDGGITWIEWTFGLYDSHILSLSVHAAASGGYVLLAGTESGLFRSDNAGSSWTEIALPDDIAPILSLAILERSDVNAVLVGSERHGLWMLPLEGSHPSPAQKTLTVYPIEAIVPTRKSIYALANGNVFISVDGVAWHRFEPFVNIDDVTALDTLDMDGGCQMVIARGQFAQTPEVTFLCH
jgi:hypothetical protein